MTTGNGDRCTPEWGDHDGYYNTGRTGTNPLTGDTFEVWSCQCGEKTYESYPKYR